VYEWRANGNDLEEIIKKTRKIMGIDLYVLWNTENPDDYSSGLRECIRRC